MFKYIRRKFGEASFTHTDSFDDAQERKHRKFLETKVHDEASASQANKYHQDSIRLMNKVVQTQEELMTR